MWPSVELPILRVTVVPYELARVTAIVCAVALMTRLNRRQGIGSVTTVLVALLALPAGFLGARLLDMVEYGAELSVSSLLHHGGSSIYGSFLGGIFALWLLARPFGIGLLAYLDAGAPALSLAEAITRLGCFAAGCCYGVPWNGPWAVVFPQGSFAVVDLPARGLAPAGIEQTPPLHPVQLYSTIVMLAVTILLVRRFPKRAFAGETFLLFLIAYGTLRLGVAPFRTEVLASMKALSIAFIVVGTLGIAWKRRAPSLDVPGRDAPVASR